MPLTGFVTIGQSPRDDIVTSMLPESLHASVLQRGALDNLTANEVYALGPDSGETPFVTRLGDGTEVLVSKVPLMPFVQRAVDDVVDAGASSVTILCTGAFPQISAPVPIILPDRILRANLDAVLPAGKIGVIMPHIDQMELMREKWATAEREFVGEAASPYTASGELTDCARRLTERGADMLVLDCMGFTDEMKQSVKYGTDRPAVLANRLIGRVIEELI